MTRTHPLAGEEAPQERGVQSCQPLVPPVSSHSYQASRMRYDGKRRSPRYKLGSGSVRACSPSNQHHRKLGINWIMFSLFACFAAVSGDFLCGGHTSYKVTYLEHARSAGLSFSLKGEFHSSWKRRLPHTRTRGPSTRHV